MASDSTELQLETSEKHEISIPSKGGNIMVTADTIYGAMRALETISQLIQFDYDTNVCSTGTPVCLLICTSGNAPHSWFLA